MNVTTPDIEKSILELGIKAGDVVLVHSSLKSFGSVEGGAMSVITACKNVLTPEGTLVMPTLVQNNFKNAIEDWSIDRPSEVGLITETFRKLPDSLRSDQETHSVSAWGKLSNEITGSHKAYGPRYGIFSQWAFSKSSPWQKMYDLNAKVVFLGISMKYHTFKHFLEYRLVEQVLENVDKTMYEKCKNELRYMLGNDERDGIWPFYNSEEMQAELELQGLLTHSQCNTAQLICTSIRECDAVSMELIKSDMHKWVGEKAACWFEKYSR